VGTDNYGNDDFTQVKRFFWILQKNCPAFSGSRGRPVKAGRALVTRGVSKPNSTSYP
jgi:hypothetical protein